MCEKAGQQQQRDRYRTLIFLLAGAFSDIGLVFKNLSDDVFDVEDEAQDVSEDYHQILVERLICLCLTRLDSCSSSCYLSCLVVLSDTIP